MKAGIKDVSAKYGWYNQALENELIYYPKIALDSWINAYRPPEAPEVSEEHNVAVKGFAEFLPDEVWAGAYPSPRNKRMQIDLFKDLLGLGITRFMDLTVPNEFDESLLYHNTLLETAEVLGRKIMVDCFPLPFRTHPTRLQVQQVLEHIERSRRVNRFTSMPVTTWRAAHP